MNRLQNSVIPHVTAWGAPAVILYDNRAVMFAGRVQTISDGFRKVSARHPILPFSLGVLIWHLLWPGTAH